jgi:hypothetical protein
MAASRFRRGRSGCWADFFPPLLPILRRKSLTVPVVVISVNQLRMDCKKMQSSQKGSVYVRGKRSSCAMPRRSLVAVLQRLSCAMPRCGRAGWVRSARGSPGGAALRDGSRRHALWALPKSRHVVAYRFVSVIHVVSASYGAASMPSRSEKAFFSG